MSRAERTKRDQAFDLWAKGYPKNCAEIKNLGLKPSSRNTYYAQWLKAGQPGKVDGPLAKLNEEMGKDQPSDALKEASPNSPDDGTIIPKGKSKVMSEDEITREISEGDGKESTTTPPTEDKRKELRTISVKPATVIEIEGQEAESGVEAGNGEREGVKREEKITALESTAIIRGSGIRVIVELSIKTFALYQYAATEHAKLGNKRPLTLGDFLDKTAEDFYQGRGLDLGLVEIGGAGLNGK
jgi:hypothetical protein